jgi:hypothetical protein
MLEADGGHLVAAEEPESQSRPCPAMTRSSAFNQDRHVDAEGGDVVGDLADLLSLVPPRVPRIGPELVDRTVGDLDARLARRNGRMMLQKVLFLSVGRGREEAGAADVARRSGWEDSDNQDENPGVAAHA